MAVHPRSGKTHRHTSAGALVLLEPRVALARLRSIGGTVTDLVRLLDRTRTTGLAAETAFWLFLSLIPLAAVMGMLAARLSVADWNHIVPLLSAMPPAAQELILQELLGLTSWNAGTVGATATAAFVWLASSGVHAIFDSIEIAADASRPWWKKRLYAIGTCLALSVLVAVLAVLGPGLEGALGWLGHWVPWLANTGEPTLVGRAFRFLLSVGVAFGFVCGLYWVGVPRPARHRMPIVPGAVLAVALEALLALVYGFLLTVVGDGGAYMAGLAVMGVTLTALWLFSMALLTGAVLNRLLGGRACPAASTPVDGQSAAAGR